MTKRHLAAVAAAMTAVLSLAGCSSAPAPGSGDASGSGAAGSAETTIRLGYVPVASAGAVQLGIEQGFFADEGLELELSAGAGGAALLPALTSGSLDLVLGHPISMFTAEDKGLDMSIVAGYGYTAAEGEGRDSNAIVVQPDSGIESITDLDGKKVSVNTINGPGDLSIKESMEKSGGDPDSIEFIELAFPDAEAQLVAGNADAIWVAEPFLTNALNNGLEMISEPYREALPQQSGLQVFSTGAWAAANAETIAKFRKALDESLTYATEHEDELRALLPEFIKMDPAVAEAVVIEDLDAEPREQVLQDYADLLVKYEYVAEPIDVPAMIAKG
ncbi:MAG TPA: ABC transporter substrate-binding protein [Microbacterium sp.]|nr:ABC transporter substrate-binding protein [Microbacterium sp.]